MNGVNNTTLIGNSGRNVVIETAGRLYVRTGGKYYEIDFRKQGGQGRLGRITKTETASEDEKTKDDFVTKEYLEGELANYITKRTWADVKETQTALENAQLEGFSESINPITIDTMQVIVGSNQLQFDFVKSFEDDTVVEHHPWIDGEGRLICADGYIKHYTLKGPSAVQPDTSKNAYYRWHVLNSDGSGLTTIALPDIDKAYYLYIVAEKPIVSDDNLEARANMVDDKDAKTGIYAKTGNAKFLVSETSYALENEIDPDNYYLLYAIINSGDSEGRSVSTMNGFTEILPGQITAYIFKSPQGDSYIDLKGNRYKFGENFSYNADGDGALKIKGAILQNDGGEPAYAVCPRGNYATNTIYYCGDTVQYTNSEGVSGTYLYKKATSGSSTDPDWPVNDSDTWELYVTGSQGKAGTTTRVRVWKSNGSITYYAGDTEVDGIYWLDFVYDNSNKNYYKCKKTHTPATGATNPAKDTTHWVLESSFSFVATSVLFAGNGSKGWVIDEGRIAHTDGAAQFTSEGEIRLGKPEVYAWFCETLAYTSDIQDVVYTTEDYEYLLLNGEIAEGTSITCYKDSSCTESLDGFVIKAVIYGDLDCPALCYTYTYQKGSFEQRYRRFSELEEYPTYIAPNGTLTVNNANIRGNLDSVTLNIGKGNFTVDEKGHMTAKDATFSGDVTINEDHSIEARKNGIPFFRVSPQDIEFNQTNETSPFPNISDKWNGAWLTKEIHTDSATLFARTMEEGVTITVPDITIYTKYKKASIEYLVLLRRTNGSTVADNLHAWHSSGFPFTEWSSGAGYTLGQYIKYNGILYKCIRTIEFSKTVPSSDTTNFAKLGVTTQDLSSDSSITIGLFNVATTSGSSNAYTIAAGYGMSLEIILYGVLERMVLNKSWADIDVTGSSFIISYGKQQNRFIFGNNGLEFYYNGYLLKFNPQESSGVGLLEMSCIKNDNVSCGIRLVNDGTSPQVLLDLGKGYKKIIAENNYLKLNG